MNGETQHDVFLELLEAWEEAKLCIIHEYSGHWDEDEKALRGDVRAWRLRYRGAA